MKHIQTWLLITLLALSASGVANAKLASGHQNLGSGLHQSQTVLNALLHQGLEQASTTDTSGSPLATKGVPNRVRVQAQGGGVEKSVDLSSTTPSTAQQGLDALENLKGQLSKSELRARQGAFDKAESFIKACERCGGVDASVSKTFTNRGVRGSDARVDIEVITGKAFTPE